MAHFRRMFKKKMSYLCKDDLLPASTSPSISEEMSNVLALYTDHGR